jgi:hypothetical protein
MSNRPPEAVDKYQNKKGEDRIDGELISCIHSSPVNIEDSVGEPWQY